MAIIKCPECGHQVSDHARTCPSCGIDIAGKVMRCPDCGEVIFNDQELCPNCHYPLHEPVAQQPLEPVTPAEPVPVVKQPELEQEQEKEPEVERQPQELKHKKTYSAFIIAFVIALIVVFLGIYFYKSTQAQNELKAYENAIGSSEPAVLQNFLDMYADAPQAHRDSIMAHLELLKKVDLDWTDAVASGSKSALEEYMRKYPTSIHNIEAGLRIDSIDWLTATTENTPDAYQTYMDNHSDGQHIDDAKQQYDKANATYVSPEMRQTIIQLFKSYFSSLANKDESGLASTLASFLGHFLNREHATLEDVLSYMRKIHDGDVANMIFSMKNDWKIDKRDLGDGQYEYGVSFSVDQEDQHAAGGSTTYSYKVSAKVSPDGKISDFTMKRLVEE